MSQLALAEEQHDIISALRKLDGTATAGDVVAATGLPNAEVQRGLKALLEDRRGHLSVTESGELLYRFEPGMIRRGSEPLLSRFKRSAWSVFKKAFKAWIVIMLVVYFVVFVLLVLAAMFAGNRDGDSRGGLGGRRGGRGGGHSHMPNLWFWYWIWGPRWRFGRPYYGRRWESTLPGDDKVPFYKKVFAFVFGPDRPEPTQQQLDRSVLRLIKARRGVLTATELVEHTGKPLPEAESEMGRLMGAYDAEAVVSPTGEVAYAFPELMMSAQRARLPREPNPAWHRLEYPLEVTGNTAGANALVAGINGFNLIAAATAPVFIFPRLGIGGPMAWLFLVAIPVIYSLSFFAVPALRTWSVKRENRRRARRNVRRVVLGLVYERALAGRAVSAEEAVAHVRERLDADTLRAVDPVEIFEAVAAEFDADVAPDEAGTLQYVFPEVESAFTGSEQVRRSLRLESRSPGDVVFATDDTDADAGRRELAAFDRQLAGYVPDTSSIGYEDDYEVVAFEEELARKQVAS